MKQKYLLLICTFLFATSSIALARHANSSPYLVGLKTNINEFFSPKSGLFNKSGAGLTNFKTNKTAVTPTPDASGILYVKKGSAGDGSSWDNAIGEFADALAGSNPAILQIWVAAGTYQPAVGQSFGMKEGVKIYGGFAGTENDLNERNWKTNITTLQGNGTTVIVNPRNMTNAAVLDGFTITGGSGATSGGGMNNSDICSPTVTNCIFKNNSATQGGGIFNWYFSSPKITNCVFIGNSASAGAGMYNSSNCSPIISNCSFTNNTSNGDGGGMLNTDSSNPSISNCSFTGNRSNFWGGALHNTNCNVVISNCVFADNTISSGTGSEIYGNDNHYTIINTTFVNGASYAIFGIRTSATFTNCIVWAEIQNIPYDTASNCLILGSTNISNGNLDATGLAATQIFNNPSTGDFTLKAGSPAINKGSNQLYNISTYGDLDLASNTRIYDTTIDLGSYEYQGPQLSVIDFKKSNLRTYPNPVREGKFYIENASLDSNATLYDISGKQLKSVTIENGKTEIDTKDLTEGIYIIKTNSGQSVKIMVK